MRAYEKACTDWEDHNFGDFPWLTGRDRDVKRADKIRFETMWDNLQYIVFHTDDAVALYDGRKMLKECTDAKWWIKAHRSGNVFHYFLIVGSTL